MNFNDFNNVLKILVYNGMFGIWSEVINISEAYKESWEGWIIGKQGHSTW